ncbi:dTDP-4-dehydrorhamnose reductase [Sinorhizobium americanum]|uniref:dTDP-4-dehydrorhamnose reductase n=1 Tax=Sinorhizobium americanum TaxID=194963 RepID=UPI0007D8F7AA|nr:dTDP-4-dehydrorhamnose reductase [Sinorhizobium americanum]OAP34043.1 dTDP-4-dehydrorhamnose reductase [Sinorhizobium americanum]
MRLVVTGCMGQLALSLAEQAFGLPGIEVVSIGRPHLDLTRPGTIFPAIERSRPDLVVSAAAYTAVDAAEDDPGLAFAINAAGAGAVAEAAARLGVPVIHISTDYVFDGARKGSYVESDAPAPLSVYGASKLAGEVAVAAANPRHVILRTSWVYSPFGTNFVKTILRLAEDCDEIAIVSDQYGNPTSALDIAEALLDIADFFAQPRPGAAFGLYHLAGTGAVNRGDFARHVLAVSRVYGGPWADIRNVTTAEFPAKARRPANASLSTDSFTNAFGRALPAWQQSVEVSVRRLVRENRINPR